MEPSPPKWLGRYHEVGMLVLGFLLTTGLGSILNCQIQSAAAHREQVARRADAERQRATQVYDEASRLAGQLLARLSARDNAITFVLAARHRAGEIKNFRMSPADMENLTVDVKAFTKESNQAIQEWSNATFRLTPLVKMYLGQIAQEALNNLNTALGEANGAIIARLPAVPMLVAGETEWRRQMGDDEQILQVALRAQAALQNAAKALSNFTTEAVNGLRAQE